MAGGYLNNQESKNTRIAQTRKRVLLLLCFAAALVFAISCAVGPASPISTASQPTSAAPTTAEEPSGPPPARTPIPPETKPGVNNETTTFVILAGSEARFVVKEQLVGVNLPGEAIGVTQAITGMIVLGPGGKIQSDQSKLTVDLATLKSNDDRRDRYLQGTTLNTRTYPTAAFVPLEAPGLISPLPGSGEIRFQITGNMTVHGVTKPLTWVVTSTINAGEIAGKATTSFKFGDFGITIPRVPLVLSVEDFIRLEFDFKVSRKN